MLKVDLDEKYSIWAGLDNVTLYYESVSNDINPKTGKPIVSKWQTYHATLGQALVRYLDMNLRASQDIKEVSEKIKELENTLLTRFKIVSSDLKSIDIEITDN